jgi:hypothetical protein
LAKSSLVSQPGEERSLIQLGEDIGRRVARAREAGFDAVKIHAGTGYLPSEFLSPRIHLRQEDCGGDVRGRAAREFYGVGDCREARRILEAIHGGDEAARRR